MNVLITGTSKGIGKALTLELLKQGHEVFALSRHNDDELQAFKNYYYQSIDLTDFSKIEETIPHFIAGPKNLDLVILNAGMLNEIKDLKDTPLNEIKQTMDLNVWANKVLLEALFFTQKEIKQVVAISSGASISGARGWNAYSLSKATLNMLIDLYAKEYTDTHFCALAPGIIDTEMQDYIYSLPDDNKYPVVQKLKKLKGTDDMPSPAKAAPSLIKAFETVKKYESGIFLDIRKL